MTASIGPAAAEIPNYPDLLRLSDKTFVVLGAGRGIGRQVAHALAQAGARVARVGRSAGPTEAVAREVKGVAIIGDASLRNDMARIAEQAANEFGRIDGVLDILGTPIFKPLADFSDADWTQQFDLSLRHVFLATQILAPLVGAAGGGSMVFVSSTSGTRVSANRAAYASSKAALEQFVRAAANEFGSLGVRFNAVAPGLISTPRVLETFTAERMKMVERHYPLGAIGTPAQIASVILFLCTDLAAHVNAQVIVADGGLTSRSPLYEVTALQPSQP